MKANRSRGRSAFVATETQRLLPFRLNTFLITPLINFSLALRYPEAFRDSSPKLIWGATSRGSRAPPHFPTRARAYGLARRKFAERTTIPPIEQKFERSF